MLDAGNWKLDAGSWMLEAGCWKLDVGSWMLDVGNWMLDAGSWMLDAGNWKKITPPQYFYSQFWTIILIRPFQTNGLNQTNLYLYF